MSQDNMFFTYASIFSKLFIQYLNGTSLNTVHESISKYYEWAKNYMHPLSLYENYLDFFTTLHKNKLGFENRITINFANNDTYFNSSANVKLIIYYFYTNQLEKALNSFYCLKKSQKREKGELQIRSLNLKGYMKVINELIPLQFYISIQISSENSMLNQDNTVL